MKVLLALTLLTGFAYETTAQNNAANVAVDLRKRGFVDNMFGNKPDSTHFEDIAGSPFLNKDFKPGRVVLRSGKAFEDVQVRFNAYQNEVVVKRNGATLAVDTAREVTYLDIEGDSSSIVILRSGYPAINNQTGSSYYQLVTGGNNVHLLKFIQRKIVESKVPGYRDTKEFSTMTSWYIYSAKDGMKKIRVNAKQVEAALPSYAAQISSITTRRNLNLTKDEDLLRLIIELDR